MSAEFHAKDGLYFRRTDHGGVEIRLGDRIVELDYSVWSSVVASVSAEGENAVSYRTARWFHMGPNAPDHPSRTGAVTHAP